MTILSNCYLLELSLIEGFMLNIEQLTPCVLMFLDIMLVNVTGVSLASNAVLSNNTSNTSMSWSSIKS